MSRSLRRTGTGRVPGSVLIAVAAWLLALTGGGALFVSFSAQYVYIVTVRRQDAASVIEALLLDLLMIVFTLLALGLSRAGKSARAERALILACAVASAYTNVSANLVDTGDYEFSQFHQQDLFAANKGWLSRADLECQSRRGPTATASVDFGRRPHISADGATRHSFA